MVALGVLLVVLGVAEIAAGFALKIHRLRRGGGLAAGAVLTIIAGALLLVGVASIATALMGAVIGQVLAAASYLHLRRSTT